MQHEHAQMPIDQKQKPEVNSHDIIFSTMCNNCKRAFSLYVVESVSDDCNF